MITAIMSTYNELDYLPLKIQWCRSNHIELYVCDNLSDDGTWEMLQHEHIPSHRYSSDGTFSERRLQQEIHDTLCRLSPDWVLYMGCDLFFTLPYIDISKYNCVSFDFLSPKYTGEKRIYPFNPFTNFTYVKHEGTLKFLFKWDENIRFDGDNIIVPNEQCYKSDCIAINYGDTKTVRQRETTLSRKRKAWENGDNLNHGCHLEDGGNVGWLWDKNYLWDISCDLTYLKILKIAMDCGLITKTLNI
jgi:glycosyltransferase involved in cell wall biosynthesis